MLHYNRFCEQFLPPFTIHHLFRILMACLHELAPLCTGCLLLCACRRGAHMKIKSQFIQLSTVSRRARGCCVLSVVRKADNSREYGNVLARRNSN